MPRKLSQLSQNSSQLSQSRINQHLVASQVNIDDQVINCVRYLINNAGQNVCFRRADIQKYCATKSGQQFQQIINRVTEILKNVYGYNFLAVEANKTYIVSNALPYKKYSTGDETDNEEVQKILLLLILSHIFMSNQPISEASLHSFLKSLKINVDIRHPLFGNVKDHITHTFLKQKYLSMETDPVSKKVNYSWGPRSEKEISKLDVLKFVCKMFKDSQPKSWETQYQIACEQGFENERLSEQNEMDLGLD